MQGRLFDFNDATRDARRASCRLGRANWDRGVQACQRGVVFGRVADYSDGAR